jgi:hypothetical protein
MSIIFLVITYIDIDFIIQNYMHFLLYLTPLVRLEA